MGEAGNTVDAIIKAGLHPQLRKAGYRKRGRTYWLNVADATRIVSISRSVRDIPGLGTVGRFGV